MKRNPTRATKGTAAPAPPRKPRKPAFAPVPVRHRDDGWTPEKQIAFIEALAECACVTEAAARVGMSVAAAYKLRARPDAASFRTAWHAALDHAVERLSDAAFSRALNGVTRPVWYQGEQVGERTYYDERLTMFILRHRDPARYGAWMDAMRFEPLVPKSPATQLGDAIAAIAAGERGYAPPWPLAWQPPVPRSRDLERERREAAANQPVDSDDTLNVLLDRLDLIERRRKHFAQLDAAASQSPDPGGRSLNFLNFRAPRAT